MITVWSPVKPPNPSAFGKGQTFLGVIAVNIGASFLFQFSQFPLESPA
jgi:hypothetical protein